MPRKRSSPLPSVEEVRQQFQYDRESGEVARRDGYTGYIAQGYKTVSVKIGDRKWEPYKAHRIAWVLHYGEWPAEQIDHINGDRLDNRLSNLRLASAAVNAQNRKSASSTNRVGLLGVNARYRGCRVGVRYEARIRANGIDHRLGWFDSPQEAHAAYLAAKEKFHDGYVSGG